MRDDEKELLGNLAKTSAVAWFFHTFVETPLHEYGHYWAASLLGAPMVIDGDRTFWAASQVVAPLPRTLIFLSGGLVAGTILLVLFALMKAPYRNGLLPLIAAQFAYAPLDATNLGDWLGLVALMVVWGWLAGVYLTRFLGWGWARSRSPAHSASPTVDP